ncbi:MAG: M13 family metallopeptidase [Muribaculaceae bacterium]|nr:M13 family metallopeptidase [Muribaculaceae bacterium]
MKINIRENLFNQMLTVLAASFTLLASASHLKSFDPKGIDDSTSASKDFYQYVNKGWMEDHPLSAEHASYAQYDLLSDSSSNRVLRILTELSNANTEKGTNAYKIASLYGCTMDSVRRNQLGNLPIRMDLDKIENTASEDMIELFLWMHKNFSSPLFTTLINEDVTDSKRYAMYVRAGGLTLGDRDYYLENDDRNKSVREAYRKLIERQMINAGYSRKDAKRIVGNVMKVETFLADSTWTREESRNLVAMFNPYSNSQLKEVYPNIPWDRFFVETMGIEPPQQVIVTEPNSIKQADNLMATLSEREKKDYYLWLYVNVAAPYLSDDFSNASFEFGKVMYGVKEQRTLWKRALSDTEGVMGEAIGELYVERYFPQSSKDYMVELVENLRTALGKHIINVPWMSDDTKVQAMKKLGAVSVKIGYPDKWRDYSNLEIDPSLSYWENIHNAFMWQRYQTLDKWGKTVDPTEWGMTPQTVNAYYNPFKNEIVFPAGMLQAPYFDPEASDAENYGGIGVVIGHELTHGFDDQGSQFDADGNMFNWWCSEDRDKFNALTQRLVKQFSTVEVLPGLMANGEYTLGENIADQGGLRIAMTAFLDSQKKKGIHVESEEAIVDGFTPLQTFYLNFANVWANNIREEQICALTASDVHSLGKNRVNVSLKNIEPFYEAFDVKEGDDMFLPEEERVIIW